MYKIIYFVKCSIKLNKNMSISSLNALFSCDCVSECKIDLIIFTTKSLKKQIKTQQI